MRADPIGFDWRFLPGIPASGSALVIYSNHCQPAEGLRAAFEQVITMSHKPALHASCPGADFPYVRASEVDPPFRPQTFDLIAFPDGLLDGVTHSNNELIKQIRSVRRLLRPGGALFLGFANSWGHKRVSPGFQRGQFRANLPSITRLLHRSGFQDQRPYGMVPDHMVPVYITPLQRESLGFALKLYFRRRRRMAWLRHLTRPGLTVWFKWLLPGYGIVAKAGA